MTLGRPPKYETPEQMQEIVESYFADCEEKKKRPTVSGLAYALDMSTEALRNYEQKDNFLATVKKAKQRVEIALEERLDLQSPVGAIFNLKNNFGWKDKTESELYGPGGGNITVEVVQFGSKDQNTE